MKVPTNMGYDPKSMEWLHCLAPDGKVLAAWLAPRLDCPSDVTGVRLTWNSPVSLFFFDTANRRPICRQPLAKPLQIVADPLLECSGARLAWSPDSRQLACWGCMAGDKLPSFQLLNPVKRKAFECWDWRRHNPRVAVCHRLHWSSNSRWLLGWLEMGPDPAEVGELQTLSYACWGAGETFHAYVIDASRGKYIHGWRGILQLGFGMRNIYDDVLFQPHDRVLITIQPKIVGDETARPHMRCSRSQVIPVSHNVTLSPCAGILVDCLANLPDCPYVGMAFGRGWRLTETQPGALLHFVVNTRQAHVVIRRSEAELNGSMEGVTWLPQRQPGQPVYAWYTRANNLLLVDGARHNLLQEWNHTELLCQAIPRSPSDITLHATTDRTLKLALTRFKGLVQWSPDGCHLLASLVWNGVNLLLSLQSQPAL